MLARAAKHRVPKLMSAHLSPQLRESHGRRTFPVREGDTVKILRGTFVGIEGKVKAVDRRSMKIHVENATIKRADGRTVFVPIPLPRVMITQLKLDDRYRAKKLKTEVAE